MVWYFSNSACQALSLKGGTVPVSGFHSTIESPDSVSLVAPPTRTIARISPATTRSQNRSARPEDEADEIVRGMSDRFGGSIWRIACRGAGDLIGKQLPARNCPESSANAHPSSQAHRRDRAHRPGRGLGAPRHGAGTTARDQGKRRRRGDLLCAGRPRLGPLGHASHQV